MNRFKSQISALEKWKTRAKPLLFILGATISLVCLYLAFRKIDWKEFGRQFLLMDFGIILLALLLVNLHNLLLAKRWQLLLKPLGKIRYWQAFWSLRISFYFNATLPARLGEPFRVFYLNKATRIAVTRALGAMGADRFLDFISLVILLYISAVVLGMRGTLPPTKAIILISLFLIISFIALARLPKHSRWKWLDHLLQLRAKLFEGMTPLLKAKVLLPSLAISFIAWFVEALVIVSFCYGVDAPISLFKAFMINAAITLAIAVPSSPGHIGTFEFAAITMLRIFGFPYEKAATVAILYHMIQLIPTLIIGAFGYHFHFLKLPKKDIHLVKNVSVSPSELNRTSKQIEG